MHIKARDLYYLYGYHLMVSCLQSYKIPNSDNDSLALRLGKYGFVN